jgi:hypothetical protein
VHCQPYAQLELERSGQDTLELGITPRQHHLAEADPKSRADRHELRDVAIRSQGEVDTFKTLCAPAHTADLRRLPIEAD